MNLSQLRQSRLLANISQRKHLSVLVCACAIVLAALVLISPLAGWADGGVRPTPTWTNTPVPPTLTPTITFPPPTPTVTLTLIPTAALPQVTAPAAQVVATQPVPTPQEPAGGGGALACMPLAIIFILGVVIAATWLLTRRSQEEVIT